MRPTTTTFGALLLFAGAPAAQTYPYLATDLGPVPGQSSWAGVTCGGISDDGRVIGGYSVWEPYVWRQAGGMTALAKPTGYPMGFVEDVNDAGVAVGSCGLPTVNYPTTAALWDPTGAVQLIGGLGGWLSWAIAVNDHGMVLGGAQLPSGNVSHAFTWTAATGVVDLTPGMAGSTNANDLNDAGQVCVQAGGTGWRWTPGTGLEPLGPVEPLCINEYGQMAGKEIGTGTAGVYTDGLGWDLFAAGSPVQLRELGGINGFGQVVGAQWILQHPSPPSYEKHGYLYTPGLGLQKLDDWIDPAQQVTITGVAGITDDGRIAAYGAIGPDNRALLLQPRFVGPHGSGCAPSSTRVPRLAVVGVPAAGRELAFLGAGGHELGVGLFAVSLSPATVPLPSGCDVLVDLGTAAVAVAPCNPIGQASWIVTLPPAPSTMAVRMYAQFATFDWSLGLASLALSNALWVDVQ